MKFNSLIIVGSSGGGKTTAVNAVRGREYADSLVVPTRLITRPKRLGDDIVENLHVTHPVFNFGVSTHTINPYWSRDLGGDAVEKYGFQQPIPEDERLRVYSANNAFIRDGNESTASVLENGLVVLLYATREERERRLFGRSPDIAQAELDKRLSDNAEDILNLPGVCIIDTTNFNPAQTGVEFQNVIASVLADL